MGNEKQKAPHQFDVDLGLLAHQLVLPPVFGDCLMDSALSIQELYGLVSIIDDYTFGDLKSFKAQFGNLQTKEDFEALRTRIKPVCQRTLRRQVLEYIKYTNRIPITQEFVPTEAEQRLYDLCI